MIALLRAGRIFLFFHFLDIDELAFCPFPLFFSPPSEAVCGLILLFGGLGHTIVLIWPT